MYEQLTFAIAIVRGWVVTRSTLALPLCAFHVLVGSIIRQVALSIVGAFVGQSCN